MENLIIYAHPGNGHCKAILDETTRLLKDSGKEFEILDLYKIKFDPVLTKEELENRGQDLDKGLIKIQEKITVAKNLIFIFPVWWNSMPAIMKGFIDRVFTTGFAYKYQPNGLPVGLIKGKKGLIFATSGGSVMISKLLFGHRFAKQMVKDILRFCGIPAKVFHLGSARKMSDSRLPEIKKMVKAGLKTIY